MSIRRWARIANSGALVWPILAILCESGSARAQDACFERLDNGVDLTGWVRSTTNHHGPGDGWSVEDGAFTGRQSSGQQGGILMTTKRYADVEVILEVKIDWGCDSGVFFRTTAGDRAYQVNVDHLEDSGVGTIYGEGFSTELLERPFTLTNGGMTAVAEQGQTPIFDLATWSTLWNPTGFNEIRSRIEGNPPRIQSWISGVKVMDFTDGRVRSEIDASGPLAIQVHSGSRWAQGGAVRFRNIRARDLTMPCNPPMDAGTDPPDAAGMDASVNGGSSGSGGASGGDAGRASAGSSGMTSGGVAGNAGGGTGGSAGSEGLAGRGGAAAGASGGAVDPGIGGTGGNAPTGGGGATGKPIPPGADRNSGCGCALPGPSRPATPSLALLALALAFVRRRLSSNRVRPASLDQ
ncbi:MAG TPA: DUF1080 domain-containing protein [Polyangiaceae bacterium]